MVRLETVSNFRDLGGLPATGGKVRLGHVFRSEAVLSPTNRDAAFLDSLGVALVCDLRGKGERRVAPNVWWQGRGVPLLDLDILADIRTAPAGWEAPAP